MIHNRPSGYSFLPELEASKIRQISIETAQAKLDCSVLEKLPSKTILLGVLDLSDMAVETPETVARRIRRALPHVPAERIMGVETGGCPHTAIREDASMNLAAIDEMRERFPDADLCFIESGGDNLAATFSPELADLTIYVIDVAAGEKIPSKGGPGITRSDLLVINKIDLAPYVGASLEVMERDAKKMRGTRPFVFTNLKTGSGLDTVMNFIKDKGGL